jgi:hypothetical protein
MAEITVLDKGDRKAYLKTKHLGRLRKVPRHTSFSS